MSLAEGVQTKQRNKTKYRESPDITVFAHPGNHTIAKTVLIGDWSSTESAIYDFQIFKVPFVCSFSLQYLLFLDFCNWKSVYFDFLTKLQRIFNLDDYTAQFIANKFLGLLPPKSLHWLFRKSSHNSLHCANSWDILKENWWRGKQDQHHFSRRLQLTKLFPQTWLLIFCLMGFWKLFNWRWFGKLFTHFQPLLETQTESRQNCILLNLSNKCLNGLGPGYGYDSKN